MVEPKLYLERLHNPLLQEAVWWQLKLKNIEHK